MNKEQKHDRLESLAIYAAAASAVADRLSGGDNLFFEKMSKKAEKKFSTELTENVMSLMQSNPDEAIALNSSFISKYTSYREEAKNSRNMPTHNARYIHDSEGRGDPRGFRQGMQEEYAVKTVSYIAQDIRNSTAEKSNEKWTNYVSDDDRSKDENMSKGRSH